MQHRKNNIQDREYRVVAKKVQLRSEEEDGKKKIYAEGYALLFEHESKDLGGWSEIVSRNALDSADMSDFVARTNHLSQNLLGRNKSGTLTYRIDDKGLWYSVYLGDLSEHDKWSQARKDLKDNLERGDIDESSFAFTIDYENDGYVREDRSDDNMIPRYRVNKILKLYDVSPVVDPAYSGTSVGVSERSREFVELKEREITKSKEFTPSAKTIQMRNKNRINKQNLNRILKG